MAVAQSNLSRLSSPLLPYCLLTNPPSLLEDIISHYESSQLPDGSLYQGERQNDKPHGVGCQTLPNGNFFIGLFENGEKHGFGQELIDGEMFSGSFFEGKRDGPGVKVFKNGDQYHGEWKNGVEVGEGVFVVDGKEKRKGVWIDKEFKVYSYM